MGTDHAMAPTPSTPGRRLFIGGCVVLFLFSAVHLIPVYFDLFTEPTEPVEIEAKKAMAAVVVDMGPFHTHLGKLFQLLSMSYSAFLFGVVTINFVALPAVIAVNRLPALALVNAIFAGVLLAISLISRFPPPAVFSLVATLIFFAAWSRARS